MTPSSSPSLPMYDESSSLFVWLMAGGDLFRKKSTVGWLLVADLL
jgi:hypothetical protein